jgi:CRISPR/Cas system CMR-associated protein Cmr5 small subunit
MNNLTTFADFAKGEPLKTGNVAGKPDASKPLVSVGEDQAEDLSSVVPELPKHSNKKFTTHYSKYFGKKPPHEELKGGDVNMKPFKSAYEKTEQEYTSLLRELNRIESGKAHLKKDVVELKKCFSDLLVKLQFFTEYKQPPEVKEEEEKKDEKPKAK